MFDSFFISPPAASKPLPTDIGFAARTCIIAVGIVFSTYGESIPKCENGIKTAVKKNLALTLLYAVIRLFMHIPGIFCFVFYYMSMVVVVLKLAMNYEAICCATSKRVFRILTGLAIFAAIVGFQEKKRGCFLPTDFFADLLALAIAIRIKSWVMHKVLDFTGYDFHGHSTHKVEKLISWICDGVIVFVTARHVGMMMYCSGVITEPCRYSEFTFQF